MEKIKIISDKVLGVLVRIAFGFAPRDKNGNIHILYTHGYPPVDNSGLLSLALLQKLEGKDKLFTLKTTISPQTIEAVKNAANDLRRKADAALVGPSDASGIVSLRKETDELDKYANYLKKNYTFDKELSLEDLQKLQNYEAVNDTICEHIFVSSEQLKGLKKFIKRYFEAYKSRLLEDQERWALPDVYAQQILSKNDSPRSKLRGIITVLTGLYV